MHSPLIRRLIEILEVSGSSYFPVFRTLFRDVIEALAEAQNIALHLKPLLTMVDTIDKVQSIESLSLSFDRLFHILALSWSNSMYYTNTNRFTGFLQQWTNLVMIKVSRVFTQRSRL